MPQKQLFSIHVIVQPLHNALLLQHVAPSPLSCWRCAHGVPSQRAACATLRDRSTSMASKVRLTDAAAQGVHRLTQPVCAHRSLTQREVARCERQLLSSALLMAATYLGTSRKHCGSSQCTTFLFALHLKQQGSPSLLFAGHALHTRRVACWAGQANLGP